MIDRMSLSTNQLKKFGKSVYFCFHDSSFLNQNIQAAFRQRATAKPDPFFKTGNVYKNNHLLTRKNNNLAFCAICFRQLPLAFSDNNNGTHL
mmetsp:Transcript_9063/g.11510  ORF Transcript_9063/g.11510 Transcript_9063/m.11510 type:complete len:92 (-) Transcript_9063:145-420(-)